MWIHTSLLDYLWDFNERSNIRGGVPPPSPLPLPSGPFTLFKWSLMMQEAATCDEICLWVGGGDVGPILNGTCRFWFRAARRSDLQRAAAARLQFPQGRLFASSCREAAERNANPSAAVTFHGLEKQKNLGFSSRCFQGTPPGGGELTETLVPSSPSSSSSQLRGGGLLNGRHVTAVHGFRGHQSV